MADVVPLTSSDGIWKDRTTGDLVLLLGGVILQRWKSSGDIDLLADEAAGDLMRHNGTEWEAFSAKTENQVVVGDGNDPISAPITGDVSAALDESNNLVTEVSDLTITDEAQGDALTFDGSNWVRVAPAGTGGIPIFDGADLTSAVISGEGAIAGDGTFTAKHPVLLHLRIPKTSGKDTDGAHGGFAGCDQVADITQTEQNAGLCKVWDDNAPTNTEQDSGLCKVEDANQPTEASATYCKVLDGEYSVAADATYVKQWDNSASTWYNLEDANADDHKQWQFFPDNIQDDDYVCFGFTEAFFEFSIDMSATIQTYTDDACVWEYWDGAAWQTLSITDGTNPTESSGTMPFVQDGTITFSDPGDWAAKTIDSVEAYWIRCRADASNVQQLGKTNSNRHTVVLNNVYASIEAAGVKDFTQWALLAANTENGDAVHLGHSAQFTKLYINISATNQTYTGDGTTWKYWNGSSWAALTVTDGTDAVGGDGKRSFTQDGYISFEAPGDWALTTIDSVEAYWIQCYVSDASKISQVGQLDSHRHYIVLTSVFANIEAEAAGQFTQWALFSGVLEANDRVYFGAAAKFGEIYINVSATNQTYTGDGTSWEYYDGETWSALTVADTTDAVGADGKRSFTQDGYVSFTQPEDWALTTIDSQEAYWIRCKITTAANVSQVGILDSHRHYTTVRGLFANIEDAADGDFVQWALFPSNTEDTDVVYFGAALPFCEMAVDMSATLQTYDDDSLAWQYWDGAAWSALTLAHDYTDATAQDGNRSFGRDGAISFVPPSDWAATTVDSQEAYWIRAIPSGGASHITQVGLVNSHRHYVCTPADAYTVPHDCQITALAIRDEAGTVHTTADIKFILMNFTTGEHSGELTFAQDKRSDKWTSLTLDCSADDVLGILVTQEDETNEMGPCTVELFATYA